MSNFIPIADVLFDAKVFTDGDWVETKDQDPEGDVRLTQLADVGDGKWINKSARFLTAEKAKQLRCTYLNPGDLLVARMPDPLGRCCVFPGDSMPCVTVVDVCVIRPNQNRVDNRYLMHVINAPHGRRGIARHMTGTTRQRVSRKNLSKVEIPLPALAQQKRIAGILDAADALRAKRREALAQLDTLIQSTFLDMFGDPVTNPIGLRRETLNSVFQFTTGKLDSNAAVEGGKYPFFTCARETSAIDDYAFDCEALLLAGNNANADYSVKHYKGRFNAYQRTYVITIKENELIYSYARLVLEYLLGDLKRFSKGTNTKYLTLVILNRMPILVPPLDLQRRFADVVESIEQQKASQRAHLAELDTLFASLQSRAFRGNL